MSQLQKGKKQKISLLKEPKKLANESSFTYILRTLLKHSPYYVTGTIFSKQLKISRVGIWSKINKLRQEGIKIEATQNRGYRLAEEPKKTNIHLLNAWMNLLNNNLNIHLHESIKSTNSEAERLLAIGEDAPFAVLTNYQTGGRGRHGKKWVCPKNGNMNLSFASRPNVNFTQMRTLTLWLGINVVKLLRKITGSNNIKIKWPNDIVIDARKIGGILTEASIDCENVKSLVIGIGINCNSTRSDFPNPLSDTITSLREISGKQISINEISAKLLVSIQNSLDKLIDGLDSITLLDDWNKLDALFNKRIQVINGKNKIAGVAQGIDNDGNLLLKLKNGEVKKVNSGDTSIQK